MDDLINVFVECFYEQICPLRGCIIFMLLFILMFNHFNRRCLWHDFTRGDTGIDAIFSFLKIYFGSMFRDVFESCKQIQIVLVVKSRLGNYLLLYYVFYDSK